MKDNYTDHFTVCWGPGLSTDSVGDKTLSYAIELLLMCTIMIFLNYATWQQLYCQGCMDYLSGKIQLLCVLQEARIAQKNFMQASWQQWTCQGGILWGSRIANSVGFFDKITELCN